MAESKRGYLSVEFLIDKSVETRTGEEASYALRIEDRDGVEVYSCENSSTISERILLNAGIYRLVASSGKDVEADFEVPFYQTEKEINLEGGKNKQIALTCSQANVKVTVDYSEAVRKHFSNYTFTVTNEKGELAFKNNEKRAGYLRVNEGTLRWNLILDNGQETYTLAKKITDVKARQHYHFTFDVSEEGGDDDGALVGGIVIDTVLDVYNWECNIVLKESTASPVLRRVDGGDFAEAYMVLAETRGADIACEVEAEAGFSELVVSHHSQVLKELGIPESFSLTGLSPEVQDAVNAAGIIWTPGLSPDAQQTTLDFSALANRLPLGEYKFYIGVYDTRFRLESDTLRISVIPDVDHMALNAVSYEVWAKFATVSGRWYTVECPKGLTLEYSTDEINWRKVEGSSLRFDNVAKSFSVLLTGLVPNQTYFYRTVSDASTSSEIKSFTTEDAIQVPYLSFDNWFKVGKNWYLGKEEEEKIWDSGNEGANTMSEKNPTAPDKTNKVNLPGNEAAGYLETKVVFGVMAAGNIYTGDFVEAIVNLSNPGAMLDFGIPYSGRPTTMSGYYKYQPVNVTQTSVSNVKKGDLDSCYIYVALFADWNAPFRVNTQTGTFVDLSTAIAYGEVKDSRKMDDFEKFTINLKYCDKTRKPTYILIVATASKYGDYFTGGEGSKLWIDEFELGFDPIE